MAISRRVFCTGAAVCALTPWPRPARASSPDFTPADVLENLARTVWIPSRPGASRVAYVIAAPWCDVCENLYAQQAAADIDCDFRFLFTEPRDPAHARRAVAATLAGRSGDLGLIYGAEGDEGQGSDFALQINGVTVDMMRDTIIRETDFPRVGYPTIVAPAPGGIYMFAGIPENLARVAAGFLPHPSAALSRSPLRYLAEEPPQLSIASGMRYARDGGAALYAAPDHAAPELVPVEAGLGHQLVGTVSVRGEDWMAFQVLSTGTPYLWGYAADFEE